MAEGVPLDRRVRRTDFQEESMSNIWLTVEVSPGAEIGRTCDEAIALAERIGITIWFNFNGVKCLARAGDDPRRLEADWNWNMQLAKRDNTGLPATKV